MRVTRIEVNGALAGRFAILARKDDGKVRVMIPLEAEDGDSAEAIIDGKDLNFELARPNKKAVWTLARRIQEALDGYRGTNGDVDDYARLIEMLSN